MWRLLYILFVGMDWIPKISCISYRNRRVADSYNGTIYDDWIRCSSPASPTCISQCCIEHHKEKKCECQ